mmetsp:Transcript_12313/g.34733  ORF Transcript_12313/g.34733 Transcript_12313/m.34733 type:complete len:207 (+) Transcript_12313:308-928(+)
MHTGSFSIPQRSSRLSWATALELNSTFSAPYTVVAMASTLAFTWASGAKSGVYGRPAALCEAHASFTAVASSAPPLPPSECTRLTTAEVAPALRASSSSASTSSWWSVGNLLRETTTGTPNRAMLVTWRARLVAAPCRAAASLLCATSSGFGRLPAAAPKAPPWSFMARTVTVMTTQSGVIPEEAALMWKNFSAPMSEPKPASVTT